MLCFREIPVTKKIMDKRGGGIGLSRLSVESIFLSQSAEKFRRGKLLCCVCGGFR